MRILGLDTSISVASVAISEDGRLVAEDFYPRKVRAEGAGAKSSHAEIILPLVDSVLRRAGIELSEVAGIAVSIVFISIRAFREYQASIFLTSSDTSSC